MYAGLFTQRGLEIKVASGGTMVILIAMLLATVLATGFLVAFGFMENSVQTLDVFEPTHNVATYEVDGYGIDVDRSFEHVGDGIFMDDLRLGELGYLDITGVSGPPDGLLGNSVEYMTNSYKEQEIDYLYQEEEFVRFTANDGSLYAYNMVTIADDDQVAIVAVITFENERNLMLSTLFDPQIVSAEYITAWTEHMMRSIVVLEEALTEETYQNVFEVKEGFDGLIGGAFFKAPEGMEEEPFMEAYLPFGGEITYLEDGYAVEAVAHGMGVYSTLEYSDVSAEAVVAEAYEEMLATENVDEERVGVTDFYSEEDIAIKIVPYFDGETDMPRVTIIYAGYYDSGYYMHDQITYYPELYTDDQPLLLEALGYVFNLTFVDIPFS